MAIKWLVMLLYCLIFLLFQAFLQKIAAFYHLLDGSTVLLRTFMAQIAVEFLLNFWHRSTFYLG